MCFHFTYGYASYIEVMTYRVTIMHHLFLAAYEYRGISLPQMSGQTGGREELVLLCPSFASRACVARIISSISKVCVRMRGHRNFVW